MTIPEDKNEARRLDHLLARAKDDNVAKYADDEKECFNILVCDGFAEYLGGALYRLTLSGEVAAKSGHGYKALYNATRCEKRHRYINTIIAAIALGLSVYNIIFG